MSQQDKMTEDREPVSSHWVEDLCRPHFSIEDVMRSTEEITKQNQVSEIDHSLPKCLRTSEGSEIYKRVLRERQQREEQLLRKNLAERLATAGVPGPASFTKSQPSSTGQSQNKQPEGSDCIWNKQDMATLCDAIDTIERDRHRLNLQLEQAQAEVRMERQERKRLRGLLDETERQLAASRQEAARWKLQWEAQLGEGRAKDTQVRALAAEAKQMAEETARWRTGERKAREEAMETRRKCSNLMWELETLKERHKVEQKRLVEAARVEENSVLSKLTQELEETRAKLKAEQKSHARSQTALELLRRHFTSSS